MIIKDAHTREQRPDGYVLAVCCDGSKQALKAVTMLCEVRGPKDKIQVIICEQANIDTAKIKQTVNDHLEEMNCLEYANIDILKSEYGKKVKDIIREHITVHCSMDIDFIFVGNNGADFSGSKESYLGSVANEIIRHTRLNTVFISQK